jgi:DNA mismatch repair protein MutL
MRVGRIRVLPDLVVNKIAAGEVVERPASVLKELLENSLDAGATRIDVVADGGGRALLRVTDNGSGMAMDDALLAFDRHATSKISSVEELSGIATLGFRGEALPSIASVSKTTLLTRREEDLSGTTLVIEGGRARSSGESGAAPGTMVEVRDLFFNVPARRSFLRAPTTENARLQETFMEEALCRPDVAFSLTLDGKRVFSLPVAAGRRDRAEALLGEEYTRRMLPVSTMEGGIEVEGLCSRPGFDFAGWDQLRTVVNGRIVRSPLLIKAVGAAFSPFALPGRKPAAILWITLAGDLLDVNVHPTKREVRFRNGGAVAQAVGSALRAALGERTPPKSMGTFSAGERSYDGGGGSAGEGGLAGAGQGRGVWQGGLGWLPEVPEATRSGGGMTPIDISPVQDLFLFEQGYRLLGQWLGTYLLIESGSSLYLVDQHVAHERILFERYRKEIAERIVSQQLLVPVSIGISPPHLLLLEGVRGLLDRLGIEAEAGGPASLLVRSLPAGIPTEEAEALVRDLIGLLPEEGEPTGSGFFDAAAARFACAAAVKAGASLRPDVAIDLLRQLSATENPYRCPHGRPIIVSIPRRTVDRAFGRE